MSGPVKLIKTRRFEDDRGWFTETYVESRWRQLGVDARFLQDKHSYSEHAGTIRGVHFQLPPHAQAKLVRCSRGQIMDYAIDLRRGSPTFAKSVAVELSAENGDQLYIPAGFGHAFVTLEPGREVLYKVDSYYAPECDAGIRWDCPKLAIDWLLPESGAIISPRDANLPHLKDFESPFDYDGRPLTGLGE